MKESAETGGQARHIEEHAMTEEDAITKLASELDEWLEQNDAALVNTGQPQKALEAWQKGAQLLKRLDAETAGCIDKIQRVIDDVSPKADDARIDELLNAFTLGARFRAVLDDELVQKDSYNKITRQLDAIVLALDKIGGRGPVLVKLLDDPRPAICATAGAYLVNLMPDRVLPLMRGIAEAERGTSAGWTAHWTWRVYEVEHGKKGDEQEER